MNAGQASGDDLGTDKKFEGFHFDRNYNVALLLFNQQLGNADIFQNSLIGGGGQGGANGNTSVDVETVSNVVYLAPWIDYKWKEHWTVTAKLVTGSVGEALNNGDTDLGFEVDLGLNYRADSGFVWVNELGFFTPGKAFEGGSSNLDTKSALGFVSKFAITF